MKDKKESKRVKELNDKCKEYLEQMQRLHADFDNYRKRMERDKADAGNYAKEELIVPLLEVIDNLERAVKAADESDDLDSLKAGVELTLKQLKEVLSKEGLCDIVAEGGKFDPEKHEAIVTCKSDEHDDDVVAEEIQKGYLFKDKVIRPSKVKVVKNN